MNTWRFPCQPWSSGASKCPGSEALVEYFSPIFRTISTFLVEARLARFRRNPSLVDVSLVFYACEPCKAVMGNAAQGMVEANWSLQDVHDHFQALLNFTVR